MPSEFETVITEQNDFGTVITTQGAAIIADCILNGKKLPITEAGAGDGGGEPTVPNPGQIALVNERWRGEIMRADLNPTTPNMIDVKIVIGDDVGGFVIREMGLYSDTGALIAVCNTPDTEKVAISGGVSGKLTMIMHLVVADASVIDFIINPALDTVSHQEMEEAIAEHNEDPEAHPDIREDIRMNAEAIVAIGKTANTALTTAELAKSIAEGAAQAIAAVQNTISVVPSQSGSLTYNGGTQLPSWNNLSLEMMDITYGTNKIPAADFTGETDAGTYKAYVTPKEDFTWGDKSRDEKEILWTIQRATITTVPSVSAPLAYTGAAQVPAWKNYDPEQLTKTETAQTNAGEHSTSFTPKPNYQWPGGDTSARAVAWTISQAANSFSIVPSGAQSFEVGDTKVIQVTTNSDAAITAESSDTSCATVSVDQGKKTVTITGTGQGAASITISSKGSTNYADASASIGVSVSRKNPTLSVSPSGNQTLTIGGSKQLAVTTNSDGAVSASSSTPGVATASASGKNVSISGASAGSATITISVPQTTKYNAASLTVGVTVEKPTVANSTWDDIRAISDAGTAASYFSTGDTKSITLNGTVGTLALSNLAVDVFILGINHNASREGSNRIHWMIGKISGTRIALCDSNYNSGYTDGRKGFNMNHWGNYNYGGWKGCDLRYDILGSTNQAPSGYGSSPATSRTGYDPSNYDIVNSPVANTLMAALPQALRKVMKTVTKYSDNKGNANNNNSSAVTSSVDYLFLLSEFEVYAAKTYANDYEKNYQEQYAYFKAGNSKQIYKHDARTTAVWGPLRSAYYNYNGDFSAVGSGSGGGVNYYHANGCGGLCAGFST